MKNDFIELSWNEIMEVDGGGTGLAIACGVLTVIATAAVAATTPGVIAKAKVAGKILLEGAILTYGAYSL